ncbi:MAG: endolytic transglycosylase MltG [Minisyncoccia bacterium]
MNFFRPSFKALVITGIAAALLFTCGALFYAYLFGPAEPSGEKREFVVSPEDSLGEVAERLDSTGLVKNSWVFRFAYLRESGGKSIRPGGYELSPSMDLWSVAHALTEKPYLSWVTIRPGWRKEQIATVLAKTLSWTPEQKQQWLTIDTAPSPSYVEGVYYPDTYLIPSDETPFQVANRLRNRFAQMFSPYAEEAARQNIKWTTVLTIASLIEREAAGPDMKLIAGIMWNRLNRGMKLQIDATLQYVKGNEEDGWWGVVKSEDKYLDSPFNTYQHVGIPPHPIAQPSLAAIAAVLDPETTKCLFYLHDYKGMIHCSQNYSGHVANVNRYLK